MSSEVDYEEDFEWDVADAFEEAEHLLLEKHRGYGPGNISGAPGGPLNGLAVRLYDKLARVSHMTSKGIDTAAGEALRDTALDIANYGIIMLLVLDNKWPTPERLAELKLRQDKVRSSFEKARIQKEQIEAQNRFAAERNSDVEFTNAVLEEFKATVRKDPEEWRPSPAAHEEYEARAAEAEIQWPPLPYPAKDPETGETLKSVNDQAGYTAQDFETERFDHWSEHPVYGVELPAGVPVILNVEPDPDPDHDAVLQRTIAGQQEALLAGDLPVSTSEEAAAAFMQAYANEWAKARAEYRAQTDAQAEQDLREVQG